MPRLGITSLALLTVCGLALTAAERDGEPRECGLILERVAEQPKLRRLIRVTPRIYCGAEPQDEEAFRQLAKLGVTTLVCVDGSQPNLEAAAKFQLRYVHIPIGYDRILKSESLAMAAALRSTKGRVFIHCHHGRQRGPAMAAIAAVADRAATGKEAVEILRFAGASQTYKGLWRDVAKYSPPSDAALPRLHESADVAPLVRAMADLDRQWDRIQSAARGNSSQQPLDSAWKKWAHLINESERSAEYFPASFRRELQQMRHDAESLSEAMKRKDRSAIEQSIRRIQATCKRCHTKYRDT